MKNHMKVAAKTIMAAAAQSHNITPLQLVSLYHHADEAKLPNLQAFSALMYMCLDVRLRQEILDHFALKIPVQIPEDIVRDQLYINQCTFLYHLIDNFYLRGVQNFESLSFYPRLADLFGPPPTVGPTIVADLEDATPVQSDAEKAFRASLKASIAAAKENVEDFGGLTPPVVPYSALKVIKWNKQQRHAFALIHKWLRTPRKDRKQIFRLFGYAGAGKTTMALAIADFVMNEAGKENVPHGGVLFAAYTGKACSVLRTKGCRGADTLHSFLYKPLIDPDTGAVTSFVLNSESPLRECGLLIIDEVSMVNEDMAADIMSFGCAILVLGDPGQLKPIQGEGYFINAEPDFMLTDIERQAADNPIIYLATRARKGLIIKPGQYGESVVYPMGRHISDEMYADHDQIICGLNATRKTINKRSRRINGRAEKNPMYPVAGEKLICLKNNKTSGLYNGTMWTASKPTIQKIMRPTFKGSTLLRAGELDVLAFKVRSLDEVDANGKPYIIKTQCSLHLFNDGLPEPAYRDVAGSDQYDFGYGATGYKTQGSQYESVLVFEESHVFRDQAINHQYTTYTRAANRISIVL